MSPAHSQQDAVAQTVLQGVLDQLTQAIWDVDLPKMMRHTTNPHRIVTREGEMTFHHDDALAKAVQQFSTSIRNMGVNYYVRSVMDARFVSADVIEGRYRNWFLHETVDVYPSFISHMVLERSDGHFLMREARNHIEADQWPLLTTGSTSPPNPE